jgi:hypothetical protein
MRVLGTCYVSATQVPQPYAGSSRIVPDRARSSQIEPDRARLSQIVPDRAADSANSGTVPLTALMELSDEGGAGGGSGSGSLPNICPLPAASPDIRPTPAGSPEHCKENPGLEQQLIANVRPVVEALSSSSNMYAAAAAVPVGEAAAAAAELVGEAAAAELVGEVAAELHNSSATLMDEGDWDGWGVDETRDEGDGDSGGGVETRHVKLRRRQPRLQLVHGGTRLLAMRQDGGPLYPIKRMRADGVVDPEVQADERQCKRISADGTLPPPARMAALATAGSLQQSGRLPTPPAVGHDPRRSSVPHPNGFQKGDGRSLIVMTEHVRAPASVPLLPSPPFFLCSHSLTHSLTHRARHLLSTAARRARL